MQNYLILMLAVVLMALDNAIRKRFQITSGTSVSAGLYFNVVLGGSAALLFWIVNGLHLSFSPYSLLLAFLQAALAVGYTVIGFRVMQESVSIYALFLMTGSMIIPWLWGVFFLKEVPSFLQVCGLILILAAIFVSKGGASGLKRRLLPLSLAVFFLNGLAAIITKLHQIETIHATVARMDFLVWVNIAKLVISAAALLIVPGFRSEFSLRSISFQKILPIILCTAVSGTAYFLQLTSASKVHATIMYPMITGGGVICSILCAWIFFRERPTGRILAGAVLCLIGTLFYL